MKKVLLIPLLLVLGNLVEAQVTLLSWDFTSIASGTDSQPSTAVADVFGTNISTTGPSGVLTRGGGIAASSRAGGFSAGDFEDAASDFSAARAAGDYFTFFVAPESGYSIDLDALEIYFDISATAPDSWGLFSSVDGFGTAIDTFTAVDGSSGTQHVLSLEDSAFNSITTSVEFQIVGFDSTVDTSGGTAAFIRSSAGPDIILTGLTSAIPEPSTYALIFGGLALGLVVWKRRRVAA